MSSLDPKVMADLRELQKGGTPGFLAELIDTYLREASRHFARLHEGLTGRDRAAVERVAHTLKGSSGNLGAKTLSGLCGRLQDAARAGNWPEIETLVPQIEREAVAVEAELAAEKNRPA